MTPLLLHQIHTDHAEWTYADLRERLGLPHSKKLEDAAREAGFTIPDELIPEQQVLVLKTMLQGVFGPEQIAKETGLDVTQVRKYCREVGVPFGAGGYGMFPWPGEEPAGAPRKVSKNGQFAYRGGHYGVGKRYARQTVWIEEDGNTLIVKFGVGKVEKRFRK